MTSTVRKRYVDCLNCSEPYGSLKVNAAGSAYGGAQGGTDGDENILVIDGQQFEYHAVAASTLIGWLKSATGLLPPVDNTDNDGCELGCGILANQPMAFTVGTDVFHAAIRFTLSAVTDFEILGVGFRNTGAYIKHQDGVFGAGLTDFAFLGSYASGNNDGSLYTVTEVNNGGMTATDTTNDIVAATPCELRVDVDADGAATFTRALGASATPSTDATLIAPTVTQTFSFDDGDTVVPFIMMLRGAANAAVLTMLKIDIGLTDAA